MNFPQVKIYIISLLLMRLPCNYSLLLLRYDDHLVSYVSNNDYYTGNLKGFKHEKKCNHHIIFASNTA